MAPSEEPMVTRFANAVDSVMNKNFERLGLHVARNPWRTIGIMFVFFFLTILGAVFNFETESRGEKLWIPQDTEALDDQDRYESYFPSESRRNVLIMEETNGELFSKEGFQTIMAAFNDIEGITVNYGGETLGFQDVCEEGNSGGYPCVVLSVLDTWGYNATTLDNDDDPESTVNEQNSVGELEPYLGELVIATTSEGETVTGANAAKLTFFLASKEEVEDGATRDERGEDFEEDFLDIFIGRTLQGDNGVTLRCYPEAQRSLSDEFGEAITGDVSLITIGYIVILIYMAINLGSFTPVKMRFALSLGCLVAVGMSVGTSIGLASAFGQFYGPVNSVLPFVILGLGVDDSFVIANSFDQTPPLPGEDFDAPTRIARALGHSGVSITVTSLTDFVAFAISTTTVLPGLSTFAAYAAIGILALFLYQVTFFTACLSLDARRQAANRVDFVCCFHGRQVDAESTKQYEAPRSYISVILKDYFGPFILKKGVREVLALGFFVMLGVFAHGASLLSVESSQRNFIPDGSYLLDTYDKNDEYFADRGTTVEVVTTDMDYFASQDVLQDLKQRLRGLENRKPFVKDPFADGSGYESWIEDFILYMDDTNPSILTTSSVDGQTYQVVADEATFYSELRMFLNGAGFDYNTSVVFETPTSISASRIQFEYVSFLEDDPRGGKRDDTDKQIDAMDGMRDLVGSWDDVEGFAWSYSYLLWETYKIIYRELIQGTGLALMAVAVITLVLIAHPVTSGLVFLCVAMTIVDILGVMFYWDLVVDNVAVIMLVLSVGLSVDYSAHVGHAFMTKQGSNYDRIVATLGDIGAAVLNGALSTFLAVVLLSQSDSYVFRVLFRLFFATVVLGVGHGMILLPILLYFVGPQPYTSKTRVGSSHVEVPKSEEQPTAA